MSDATRMQRIVEELSKSEMGKRLVDLCRGPAVGTGLAWDARLAANRVALYCPIPTKDGKSYVVLNPSPEITDGELVLGLSHDLVHGIQHKMTRTWKPEDVSEGVNRYAEQTMRAEREAYSVACLVACELKAAGYPAAYEAAVDDANYQWLLSAFEKELEESLKKGSPISAARDNALGVCASEFDSNPELLELRMDVESVGRANFDRMVALQRDHGIER